MNAAREQAVDPSAKARLAKIRHDLRTPIHHIIGYSEILAEELHDEAPERFLQDLQNIRSGGVRLLALIQEHLSDENLVTTKPDLHLLCHELRTPVNHILGYSELLMEQCADLGWTDSQADLAKIHAAGKTWLALMEQQLMPDTEQLLKHRPRSDVAETGFPPQPQPETTEPASPLPRQRITASGRLLLADDDESNRELLRRRLEKLGYTVTACCNGAQALQEIRSAPYDLILLDLLMPELDGNEVLERLKADPALQHVPVIMISALDQLEGIVRCIELGAEDYIAKPFNPIFLRARIGAALEKKWLRDREVSYLRQIQQEKQRSEELLHIILPADVADELKATNAVAPRRFENVGVLFCDIVGFTAYCNLHPPEEILGHLQAVVDAFEELTSLHGLEKIKTIGDSFMAAIGLRTPAADPARCCIRCGLDMIVASRRLPPNWEVRVGVHVGPVIAGVVGHRKYQYDVWGDTVNLAARMQEAAAPSSICVTAESWRLLDGFYPGHPVGTVVIKGKGPLQLFHIQTPDTRPVGNADS